MVLYSEYCPGRYKKIFKISLISVFRMKCFLNISVNYYGQKNERQKYRDTQMPAHPLCQGVALLTRRFDSTKTMTSVYGAAKNVGSGVKSQ